MKLHITGWKAKMVMLWGDFVWAERRSQRLFQGLFFPMSVAMLVGLAAVSGCVLPPKESAHLTPLEGDRLGLSGVTGEPFPDCWWSSFGDAQLDLLICAALKDSPTCAEAQARVADATARSQIAQAKRLPTATVDAIPLYQRAPQNHLIPPPLAGFAVSFFMRAQLTIDSSYFVFMAPQLVQGLAMGLFFVSLLAVAFDGLSSQKVPAASGLSNFARITAGGFATSLVTTLWDRREALHQSHLADIVIQYAPAYQEMLSRMHDFGMSDAGAAAAILQGMIGQSYLLSSLDLFEASAWISVLLIPLCFFSETSDHRWVDAVGRRVNHSLRITEEHRNARQQ